MEIQCNFRSAHFSVLRFFDSKNDQVYMGNTKIVYFFLWFNFNLSRWVPVNMCYTSADCLHFFLYSLSSLSLKFLPPLLGWRSQNAAMTRALSLPFVVHPTQSYDGSIKIRYIFNFMLVNLLCTIFFFILFDKNVLCCYSL